MILTKTALVLLLAAPTLTGGAAEAAPGGEDLPTIEDASLDFADGRLSTEIFTSLPVFREDVRAKVDGRNLIIYVESAVVDSGKRSFGEGARTIRAYPRATYAKLEIPMPAGVTCGGAAAIAVDETTVRVSMACGAGAAKSDKAVKAEAIAAVDAALAAAPSAESAPAVKIVAKSPTAAQPTKAEAGTKIGNKIGSDGKLVAARTLKAEAEPTPAPLKALLQESAAASADDANAAAAAALLEEANQVAAKAAADKIAADKVAQPATITTKAPKPDTEASNDAKTARSPAVALTKSADTTSPLFAGGALAAIAVAGLFVWRRRKDGKSNHIRIIETASLGPKRALIVAEIDGEKVILGTSEAGISVLTPTRAASPWGEQTMSTRVQLPPETTSAGTPMMAAAAMAGAGMAVPMALPANDDNEGGILSRLFRRKATEEISGEHELGNMEDEFRDLLADSIEDEELRRRLQAGLGGRTS